MHSATIPTIDDLTPAWFTSALHSSGALDDEYQVTAVELSPFGDAASMMSSLHRAALTYDGPTTAPGSLVVKLASPSEGQLFVAGLFKFYEREIRFYDEIAERMTIEVPRCHLAAINPENQHFVLVLDEVSGRRAIDQIDGVGRADAETALRELASLHAPHWGSDLSSKSSTFLPFDGPLLHQVLPDHFAGDWAKVRPKVAKELPAAFVELCDNWSTIAPAVLAGMHGPDTLCHGDFRSDNLLFDADGEVLVLDYQLAAVASGLTDVAYFISQSVDDEVAAAHGDELIQIYVDQLASLGIEIDHADAMDRYRAGLVFYISIPVGMLAFDHTPERADQLGRTMLRRIAAEAERSDTYRRFAP